MCEHQTIFLVIVWPRVKSWFLCSELSIAGCLRPDSSLIDDHNVIDRDIGTLVVLFCLRRQNGLFTMFEEKA